MEGQVDEIEVTLVPILLGGGVPLLSPGAPRTRLALIETETYATGMIRLVYAVDEAPREGAVRGPETAA
jgi:riboflavin biosynthesis pyrimidine reductase